MELLAQQINSNYLLDFSAKFLFAVILSLFIIRISGVFASFVRKKFIAENIMYYEGNTEKIWNLIKTIIHYVSSVIWVQLCFSLLWIDLGPISWWFAVAVWFILWERIENIVSWIFIISNKNYKLWKFVTVQLKKWKTVAGKIIDINRRYTTLLALDKTVSVIPNKYFIKYPIKMLDGRLRIESKISIVHDCDIDLVTRKITDNLNKFDFIEEKEKTAVLVDQITTTGLNIVIWSYVKLWKTSILKAKSDINTSITNTLKELGLHHQFDEKIITIDKNDKNFLSSWSFFMKKYNELK